MACPYGGDCLHPRGWDSGVGRPKPLRSRGIQWDLTPRRGAGQDDAAIRCALGGPPWFGRGWSFRRGALPGAGWPLPMAPRCFTKAFTGSIFMRCAHQRKVRLEAPSETHDRMTAIFQQWGNQVCARITSDAGQASLKNQSIWSIARNARLKEGRKRYACPLGTMPDVCSALSGRGRGAGADPVSTRPCERADDGEYLGCRQRLKNAVNDCIGIEPEKEHLGR